VVGQTSIRAFTPDGVAATAVVMKRTAIGALGIAGLADRDSALVLLATLDGD